MFYISEEIFIDKFIACMRLRDIEAFDFDTDSFYAGIEKMRQFFLSNRNKFGNDADEISLLFIKNPIEGVYSRFRDAISEQNGSTISFENPKYTRSAIKISKEDAKELLRIEHLSVDDNYVEEMTDEFCVGARLIDEKK